MMAKEEQREQARTRVLVVDDHVPYRWGLMEVLLQEQTVEVVEEASNGDEAVEKARAVRPEVVIMDLQMPKADGVEATRRIQEEMPEVRIIVSPAMERRLKEEVGEPEAKGEEGPTEAAEAVAEEEGKEGSEEGEEGSPPRQARADDWVKEAELVLAPPVEPRVVLELYGWLQQEAKGDIERIGASFGEATVIRVTFRDALVLKERLRELPYVGEVRGEGETSGEETGGQVEGYSRFRLVLKGK